MKQWRSFTLNQIDSALDDLGARKALSDEEEVYPADNNNSLDVDHHHHSVADQQRPRKIRKVSFNQQSSATEPAQQPTDPNPPDTQPSMAAAMLDARANRVGKHT